MPETIGARLARLKTPAGFDYLRLILAIAVLVIHSVKVVTSQAEYDSIVWSGIAEGPARLVLPMFFALSGFLVAGSAVRAKTVSSFAILRALRLVPALAVEVGLSAVILGGLVTTLPLSDYYASSGFWSYFLNIVGDIHFKLPGVFEHNPYNGAVNISLWTVPFELECYIALCAIMLTRMINVRLAVLGASIAYTALIFAKNLHSPYNYIETGAVEPRVMVASFLGGLCIYLYRDMIKMDARLFAIAIVSAVALMYERNLNYFAVPSVAYATVWLGMTNPKKAPILFSGDYSYGIYLYAFPVQQAVVFFLPEYRYFAANLVLSLAISGLFAAFSWHCIEKHALSLKGYLASEKRLLPKAELRLMAWIAKFA